MEERADRQGGRDGWTTALGLPAGLQPQAREAA